MCDLPRDIPNDEQVVRAIKRLHLKSSGHPKPNALRPPPGESAVSVVRHAMGDDFCKDKCREIAGPEYSGVLALPSSAARNLGSEVLDFRDGYFCGHAHIDHGILVPPAEGEPLDPATSEKLTDLCREIIAHSKYLADPSPEEPGWSGPPL